MSFLDEMKSRYSTKIYDETKKLDEQKIKELKEILRLSPSSINSQPWKFTFVSDEETKSKLAEASYFNKEKINHCDTLVVFNRINNLDLFESIIEKELPENSVNYFKNMVKPQPEEKINAWFDKQVYLALGVLLSACADMGIDSTPMEGIEHDKYNEILNQKDYTALMAVSIGYRDPEDKNQPSKTPKSRRAFDEVIESI